MLAIHRPKRIPEGLPGRATCNLSTDWIRAFFLLCLTFADERSFRASKPKFFLALWVSPLEALNKITEAMACG